MLYLYRVIVMKQQTIVFKVSDNLRDEIIDFYQDRAIENKPPYSVFQVFVLFVPYAARSLYQSLCYF